MGRCPHLPAANPERQLLPHIRHASLILPNCPEIPLKLPKKSKDCIYKENSQCVPQGNSSLLPLTERKSQEPCVCAIRVSGGNTCLFIYLLRKGARGRAISSLLSMAGNMAPNLPAPLPATCWKPADVLHGAPHAPSARTANTPSYTSLFDCDFSHPFVHVSEEHYNKCVFSGEAFSKSWIENCSQSHMDITHVESKQNRSTRCWASLPHTPQSLNASADLLAHSSGLPSLLLPVVCWGTTALPPPAPSANDCSGSGPWNEVNPWDFFRLQNPNINLSKYQPGFPDDEELSSGSVGPAESLWPLDSLPPQQGHPRADTKGNNQWFRMSSSSDLALRKQMTLLTCPVEAWFWLVLSLTWINFQIRLFMTFIQSCIMQANACAGQRLYSRVEDTRSYEEESRFLLQN